LAPKGVFDQKFGPFNFFDQDFGPLVKKVGHPWFRGSKVHNGWFRQGWPTFFGLRAK
jgi:hypothetical protein